MKTTLKQIRAHSPCGMSLESGQREGYLLLKHNLGAGYDDTTPISIPQIIDSNGLDDALWCLRAVDGFDREKRLFAVWCARRVQHLMTDPRSVQALDVAERFANGTASSAELGAARAAAWAAQTAELRRVCAAIDAGQDPYPSPAQPTTEIAAS
jgi:hypothetical protein